MWTLYLYLELLLLLSVPFALGALLARLVVRLAVRRSEADVAGAATGEVAA